jgi:hypothetical protein
MRMIRASAVLGNRLVGNRKDPHLAIATHSGIDLKFSNSPTLAGYSTLNRRLRDRFSDQRGVQMWIRRQRPDR